MPACRIIFAYDVQTGLRMSGLLVRKNFDLHMVDPDDVHAYSTLKTSKVTHRQILQLKYSGSFARFTLVIAHLNTLFLWVRMCTARILIPMAIFPRLQSELQKAYENCDELPKDYGVFH